MLAEHFTSVKKLNLIVPKGPEGYNTPAERCSVAQVSCWEAAASGPEPQSSWAPFTSQSCRQISYSSSQLACNVPAPSDKEPRAATSTRKQQQPSSPPNLYKHYALFEPQLQY